MQQDNCKQGGKFKQLFRYLVETSKTLPIEFVKELSVQAGLDMSMEVIVKQLLGEETEDKCEKAKRDTSGPRFGLDRPWLRITCQLMKVKSWSAEDISATATKAGIDMPTQFLKWKIESLSRDKSCS